MTASLLRFVDWIVDYAIKWIAVAAWHAVCLAALAASELGEELGEFFTRLFWLGVLTLAAFSAVVVVVARSLRDRPAATATR